MSEDQKLILTRGIPGSGKSTWAEEWVRRDPANRARVNRDDIRFAMYGKYVLTKPNGKMDGDAEARVTEMEHKLIRQALKEGKDVVSDNTNLNTKFIKPYLNIAAEAGVKVAHKDFPISIDEAKRRNRNRARKVPDHVIDRMYSGLGPNGQFHLFPGSYPLKPFVKPATREPAFGFDMDGSLADTRNITHYVRGKHRDFDAFHRNSLFVPPNPEVLKLAMDAHKAGLKVIITTARGEAYRQETQAWCDYYKVPYDNIFMREEGDFRSDYEVKKEMFDTKINPNYDLVRQCDDNPSAIKAFEEKGIPVTVVPDFNYEGSDRPVLKIDNLFTRGVCVRCGRSFKGEGVLGPNCRTKA